MYKAMKKKRLPNIVLQSMIRIDLDLNDPHVPVLPFLDSLKNNIIFLEQKVDAVFS